MKGDNSEVFTFGGYHFIPYRNLSRKESSLYAISRRQRIDIELGFCIPGYVCESKFPYSHESFYAASTSKTSDLFRCVENGKIYIPCQNDLQEYIE